MIRLFPALLTLASWAGAYNHPEIHWQTVRTRHFSVNYYGATECAVYPVAKMAEESYAALSQLYNYSFQERISISLADYDDYSNGFARWTDGSIVLWVPDMRFDLRGNTVWLRNVLIHELAHIMTLAKQSRAPWLDNLLDLRYESPHARISLQTPLPMTTFYPHWFSEGVAQLESERAGGDRWDSRRDMLLRCAILEGKQLSLDAMSDFNHTSLGNEMVYNQGYSLVRHIQSRFGHSAIAALWSEGRLPRLGGRDFSASFERVTGTPLREVYDGWIANMRSSFLGRVPREPVSGAVQWARGSVNNLPRISPDGSLWGWLSSDGDDSRRTDLILLRAGSSEVIARVAHVHTAWDFSSDGRSVHYVKSRSPDANGSFYNDVYRYDIAEKRETRLTQGARVYDIASLPGGDLVCTRYSAGAFSIHRYDHTSGTFSRIVHGRFGEPFAGISVSSDGAAVATCRIVEGNADIVTVDLASGTVHPLVASPSQEESAHWGRDGRIYFSADYGGIFDIFSVDSAGADLRRHTRVQGGAFSPVRRQKFGIIYTEFGSKGFEIRAIESKGMPFDLPETEPYVFNPMPPRGKTALNPRPYYAEKLRRVWETGVVLNVMDGQDMLLRAVRDGEWPKPSSDSLRFVAAAHALTFRTDALDKKSRQLSFFAGGASGGYSLLSLDNGWRQANQTATPGRRNPFDAPRFRNPPPLLGTRAVALRMARAARQEDAGDTLAAPPAFAPVVGAAVFLENRVHGPTMDLSVVARTDFSFLLGLVNPSLSWHVHRDWYIGLAPLAYLVNLLPVGAEVPAYVSFQNLGYYNEDLAYNLGGLTSITAYGEPFILFMPMLFPGDNPDVPDTTLNLVGGFAGGISITHGVPLARYFSLVFQPRMSMLRPSRPVLDPSQTLVGESNGYLDLAGSIRFVFPVIRTINRGRRLYADALYGNLFYTFSEYANRAGMESSFLRAMADPKVDTGNVTVRHLAGVGTELGLTKSYLFFRTLSTQLAWDFWKREVDVDIGLTF